MSLSKAVLIGLIMSTGSNVAALANERLLKCTTGQVFQTFQVSLDDSSFEPGSGFFRPENAAFGDNYLTLQGLTCAGSTLDQLGCVGFAFGNSEDIVEVRLVKKDNQFFSHAQVLKGLQVPLHGGDWPCTIE